MSKKEDIGGVWRTVGGRRIFIKEGQDLNSAMEESKKFKVIKSVKKEKNNEKEKVNKKENKIRDYKEITKEELEEIKKIADIRDEDGFKLGIEKAVLDKYRLNQKFPETMSTKDYNNFKSQEIFRGISADSTEKADKYLNDVLNGDIYVGFNNSGTGMWFSENKGISEAYKSGDLGTSAKNGKNSFVIEAKLKPDAKIIKVSDLPDKRERMKMYGIENDNALSKIVYDDGLYAAMLGYDGIMTEVGFTKKTKNVSILNREAIVIKNDNK